MFDFLIEIGMPCMFHAITGLYCPGCGGTRSLHFLLNGDVIRSLIYHPIIVFGLVGFCFNCIKLGYFTAVRRKFVFKLAWIWWLLIIMAINWIVKDVALLCGFDLLTL